MVSIVKYGKHNIIAVDTTSSNYNYKLCYSYYAMYQSMAASTLNPLSTKTHALKHSIQWVSNFRDCLKLYTSMHIISWLSMSDFVYTCTKNF